MVTFLVAETAKQILAMSALEGWALFQFVIVLIVVEMELKLMMRNVIMEINQAAQTAKYRQATLAYITDSQNLCAIFLVEMGSRLQTNNVTMETNLVVIIVKLCLDSLVQDRLLFVMLNVAMELLVLAKLVIMETKMAVKQAAFLIKDGHAYRSQANLPFANSFVEMESKPKMKSAITAKVLDVCPVHLLTKVTSVLEMMGSNHLAKQYVEIISKLSMSNAIMETRLDARRTASLILDIIGTQL